MSALVYLKLNSLINKLINEIFCSYKEEPGPSTITSTEADIQATSLTVKWTEPTDIGGSPITAYRVVVLQGVAEIKNSNITDPALKSWPVGELKINTNYTVKVFARNFVFEGNAVEKIFQTKFEGGKSLVLKGVTLPADNYILFL